MNTWPTSTIYITSPQAVQGMAPAPGRPGCQHTDDEELTWRLGRATGQEASR
ncbi:hypothetical protein ABZW30_08415 [Kitasatospora sp. NPDC004669]|uniref:hypothetical protein n=1 Tax=Kitasatospora sp. NPDC004669 TaxID=3154555 RepID=UPI0033A12FE7